MDLSEIFPAIFSGLGLKVDQTRFDFGQSPQGRECLLLVDGLGALAFKEFSAYLPSMSSMNFVSQVNTAFPSTTATSLTTLMTGVLPGIHGMLGYTVRVPRSGGRVLNSLKWDERVDPQTWQPVPTIFERARSQGIEVSHLGARRYENSGFTRAAFRGAKYRKVQGLGEMITEAKKSLQTSPAFTYLYLNDLDVAGHDAGVGSDKWLGALAYVEKVVESLLANLPSGTRFWVTADHGMVNAGEKVVIGKENSLLETVETIAGEPRARHIYLSENHLSNDRVKEVASNWQKYLAGRASVYTRMSAIEVGLFGTEVTLESQERIGDLVVVAHSNLVLIDPDREKLESAMVGHHGALTDAERIVPLVNQVIA